jgi:AraC-like DNA-binding protein
VRNLTGGDKIHSPTKLAAIVEALVNEGIAQPDALRNTGIAASDLNSSATAVSLRQILTACDNAVHLSRNPSLPYNIGCSIHLSSYGMFGFAILCSTSFRQAMGFAIKYQSLAAPLVTIVFSEEDDIATWTLEPMSDAAIDRRICRFIIELQIGIHISLHRDIMGPTFVPKEISLAYERSDDFHLSEDLVGCPVNWNRPVNRISFDAAELDRPPRLGNRITYEAVVAMCDDLLSEMTIRSGLAAQLRQALIRDLARQPTLEKAAADVGMTTRTIRRQLTREGTSFRALLDEVRSAVAMKFLRETNMTNDDIAEALGFADPANFRRAFRRWTGASPLAFRR